MLKKLLYNKYKILNIDKRLPYNSEEILKILYTKKNCIFFEYGEQFRLLGYTGFEPDFLGRATKFQPMYIAGSETYNVKTKEDAVIYNENVLQSDGLGWNCEKYVIDEIQGFIDILDAIDKSIIINTRQVLIPFVAKTTSTNQAIFLKNLLKQILGKDYESLIVECKLTDKNTGTIIETTNINMFVQQLQDAKKKILEEAFLYLGVGAPAGKLAHESIVEVEQNEQITDLLDKVMFYKISDFLDRCNNKFNLNMKLVKIF